MQSKGAIDDSWVMSTSLFCFSRMAAAKQPSRRLRSVNYLTNPLQVALSHHLKPAKRLIVFTSKSFNEIGELWMHNLHFGTRCKSQSRVSLAINRQLHILCIQRDALAMSANRWRGAFLIARPPQTARFSRNASHSTLERLSQPRASGVSFF